MPIMSTGNTDFGAEKKSVLLLGKVVILCVSIENYVICYLYEGITADQQAYDGTLRCSIRRTRVAANC